MASKSEKAKLRNFLKFQEKNNEFTEGKFEELFNKFGKRVMEEGEVEISEELLEVFTRQGFFEEMPQETVRKRLAGEISKFESDQRQKAFRKLIRNSKKIEKSLELKGDDFNKAVAKALSKQITTPADRNLLRDRVPVGSRMGARKILKILKLFFTNPAITSFLIEKVSEAAERFRDVEDPEDLPVEVLFDNRPIQGPAEDIELGFRSDPPDDDDDPDDGDDDDDDDDDEDDFNDDDEEQVIIDVKRQIALLLVAKTVEDREKIMKTIKDLVDSAGEKIKQIEWHLPGHRYTGPGTKIEKVDKFLETGVLDENVEPVNELDYMALQHDLRYATNDVEAMIEADTIMLEQMREAHSKTKNVKLKAELELALAGIATVRATRINPKLRKLLPEIIRGTTTNSKKEVNKIKLKQQEKIERFSKKFNELSGKIKRPVIGTLENNIINTIKETMSIDTKPRFKEALARVKTADDITLALEDAAVRFATKIQLGKILKLRKVRGFSKMKVDDRRQALIDEVAERTGTILGPQSSTQKLKQDFTEDVVKPAMKIPSKTEAPTDAPTSPAPEEPKTDMGSLTDAINSLINVIQVPINIEDDPNDNSNGMANQLQNFDIFSPDIDNIGSKENLDNVKPTKKEADISELNRALYAYIPTSLFRKVGSTFNADRVFRNNLEEAGPYTNQSNWTGLPRKRPKPTASMERAYAPNMKNIYSSFDDNTPGNKDQAPRLRFHRIINSVQAPYYRQLYGNPAYKLYVPVVT